jgi:L-seryl-tRNA(Ser) seleniumtransferase
MGGADQLIASYGRPLTVAAIREALEEARVGLSSSRTKGEGAEIPSGETILAQAGSRLEGWTHPALVPVINATGVILHTNLGRAPLSAATLAAMRGASGYTPIELDVNTGKRGDRFVHAEDLLKRLTGGSCVVTQQCRGGAARPSALAARRRWTPAAAGGDRRRFPRSGRHELSERLRSARPTGSAWRITTRRLQNLLPW